MTLGEYAFIASGAVVTKDIPPYGMVAGVPATRIGWACGARPQGSSKAGGDMLFVIHLDARSNRLLRPAAPRGYERQGSPRITELGRRQVAP